MTAGANDGTTVEGAGALGVLAGTLVGSENGKVCMVGDAIGAGVGIDNEIGLSVEGKVEDAAKGVLVGVPNNM